MVRGSVLGSVSGFVSSFLFKQTDPSDIAFFWNHVLTGTSFVSAVWWTGVWEGPCRVWFGSCRTYHNVRVGFWGLLYPLPTSGEHGEYTHNKGSSCLLKALEWYVTLPSLVVEISQRQRLLCGHNGNEQKLWNTRKQSVPSSSWSMFESNEWNQTSASWKRPHNCRTWDWVDSGISMCTTNSIQNVHTLSSRKSFTTKDSSMHCVVPFQNLRTFHWHLHTGCAANVLLELWSKCHFSRLGNYQLDSALPKITAKPLSPHPTTLHLIITTSHVNFQILIFHKRIILRFSPGQLNLIGVDLSVWAPFDLFTLHMNQGDAFKDLMLTEDKLWLSFETVYYHLTPRVKVLLRSSKLASLQHEN